MKGLKATKEGECEICGKWGIISHHHVFNGTKHLRALSEKYGAIVWVDWGCHVTNNDAIHKNEKLRLELKEVYQVRIMREQNWNIEQWREVFGKNYL